MPIRGTRTATAPDVPVIDEVPVSVAVMVWAPAVLRVIVKVKVWVPASPPVNV
jgi:hypothetical protein